MMRPMISGIFLLLAGVGLAGWHYQARIVAFVNPPPSASHPAAEPDVLYSWVDKEGVTHYEQRAGKGNRLEYDGSRITRLEPVQPELLAKAEAAVDDAKPKGSELIHGLRAEMLRNQQKMQESRDASRGF